MEPIILDGSKIAKKINDELRGFKKPYDSRFLSDEGSPRDLAFDEGDPSFTDLVRSVAGDVRQYVRPMGRIRAASVGLLLYPFIPGAA